MYFPPFKKFMKIINRYNILKKILGKENYFNTLKVFAVKKIVKNQ